MNIAFFVSAHGFGHAARATAVMAALQKLHPHCDLEVFTRVPDWFFSDVLPFPFRYHSVTTDVGVIQKDPFAGDPRATLEEIDRFLPFSEALVGDLAGGLVARGCRAVVCDISPLGIAVALKAGIPSILVENFTWDWLYAPYRAENPGFGDHMATLAAWFSKANVHIQTEPVCRPDSQATLLNPISRLPKTGPAATRKALGVSRGPLVFLTSGGVAVRHRFLEKLEALPNVSFVVPHHVPRPSRRGNVINLPHRSDFYHPDLVGAADLVVGKLGYSTLAEVGHAGKPFGYILRQDSRETGPLAGYAERNLKGRPFSEEAFSSGRWLDSLDALLSQADVADPAFPNDAHRAAEIILDTSSVGAAVSSRKPSRPFDPFNDRRSRDIRNRLSEAFVTAVEKRDPGVLHREAEGLIPLANEAVYRHYVDGRKGQYLRVLEKIESLGIENVEQQAVIIWNADLFFECHDHLEVLWSGTTGRKRKALQGLIQAAGVFVHRQLHRDRAADRLSARAAGLLEVYGGQLSFIANIDELIAALKQKGAEAPELKGR